MTNNDIDLSRRRFYKATDYDGKSFLQPVDRFDTEYAVGKETLPLQRSNDPRMRSAEALHGMDDPESAIRYAIYQMTSNVLSRHRSGHGEWTPRLHNDDHPYGMRLFTFRGTPFDGSPTFYRAGSKEYGFTRIKPENERNVEDFFEGPSPLPLVNRDFDHHVDLVTEILETLAEGIFGGKKYGGYLKYRTDSAKKAIESMWIGGRLDREASIDEQIWELARRHADRTVSLFWNMVDYNDRRDDLGDKSLRIKTLISRKVEDYGYVPHGENQWELTRMTKAVHTAKTIADVDPDYRDASKVTEAYEELTGPSKRLLLISVPDVQTQTDRYHRVASLHGKIRNLIEKEYDDLGDVEVTATQA